MIQYSTKIMGYFIYMIGEYGNLFIYLFKFAFECNGMKVPCDLKLDKCGDLFIQITAEAPS